MRDHDRLEKLKIAAGNKQAERKYWLEKLSGELFTGGFPAGPGAQLGVSGSAGDNSDEVVSFIVEGRLFNSLMELSTGSEVRLFIALTSILTMLLGKYTGNGDIAVGTSVLKSQRDGELINTMCCLRSRLTPGMTFKELLMQVRDTVVEADKYRNYPLEILTKELGQESLFDTAILVENIHDPQYLQVADPGVTFFFLLGDKSIRGRIRYKTSRYRHDYMEQLAGHFKNLAGVLLDEPGKRYADTGIITADEKREILHRFNNFEDPFTGDKTIPQLFRDQVERTPDSMAVIGYGPSGNGETQLTYRELDRRTGQLASMLNETGAEPGDLVGLLVERSVEMIIGIIGILYAGCAYVPLNPNAPTSRNRLMLADCNVRTLLTANDLTVELTEGLEVSPLPGSPGHLAYVIYTSGSTGMPRGVAVTHANFCQLIHWGYRHLGMGPKDRVLQNLSYYFDWSVWEIFITLTTGASLCMVPGELLLDPQGSAGFMNTHGVTVLHVTPTQYQYIAGAHAEPAALRYLFIGAEKLTYDLVKRSFASVHKDCRVFNMYGPTETTIISAVLELHRDSVGQYRHLTSVPIGTPAGNTSLFVLDKYMNLCPVGIPGELHISGGGVTRGYLNNPELTAEKFVLLNRSYGTYRTYKTGDLARWLSDGSVEFLGRIDQQVKIRGFRIELGEIENRLLEHEGVREAVVIDRETEGGEKYLCAYVVYTAEPVVLKEYLSGLLPDYMVPAYFVEIQGLPLNPNGKVNRGALPLPDAGSVPAGCCKPRTGTELKLAEIWAQILETQRPFGIDDNFFEIGGHSLRATLVTSKIHEVFDVKLELTDVFTNPTIRMLAEVIAAGTTELFSSIGNVEEKTYYALSSAQKRLYILQQMDRDGVGYNMPFSLLLEGEVDIERLTGVFKDLVSRHESLRTSFEIISSELVQRIHEEGNYTFQITHFGQIDESQMTSVTREFIAPFDLAQAPLMRVGLAEIEKEKHMLMVDMHHIVSDGASISVMVKEFAALYQGKELPPLKIHYKDFAAWQNRESASPAIGRQEAYWLDVFGEDIPVLELPCDYARPGVQSFEGSIFRFEIGSRETAELKVLADREGVTLFMTLLAVYNIFLAKIGGRETVVVGTPIAGRRHSHLESVIGIFVNTLALKNEPSGVKTAVELLKEVKQTTIKGFENQDYPYEELVEKLSVPRDTGRNPLFDTMLVLQNKSNIPDFEIPGLTVKTAAMELGIAKFDLLLQCTEIGGSLLCYIEYCTELFKRETIERFAGFLKGIVSSVVTEPELPISDIPIIDPGEKEEILYRFNNCEEPFTGGKTIPQLFRQQVERTPDALAVTGYGPSGNGERQIAFSELHRGAVQLASLLAGKGAEPGDLVGLLAERSVEMIIGIIGILYAGCAYVPLNPNAPTSRNRLMLEDCNVRLLVTATVLPLELAGAVEDIPVEGAVNCAPAVAVSTLPGSPDQLAYVIYTSGSTGMPKGVGVTHANFCQLIHWGYRHLGIGPKDRTLQNLSYYFDWSVWEIFITLTTGASLYMVPDVLLLDPRESVNFMTANGITVLHVTPTQYRYIAGVHTGPVTLRYLFIGAEKLTYDLVTRSFARVHEGCRVFNMYGPTEATIISAALELHRDTVDNYRDLSSIPIGIPTGNTSLFILDKYMNLCPVGIPGELHIAGGGVVRGYINNPELTAEKFVLLNRSYGSYRTYKTGDLARWLPDGSVEFLGRIDQQVKIRGFRIELGEIEARLQEHDEIQEAVVTCGEKKSGEKYLCAYFTSLKNAGIAAIRGYLAQHLPGYMIPAYFMQLESIPLNPNGKTDLKRLPQPEIKTLAGFAAPQSGNEKLVARVWQEVLEQEKIGLDDNLFEIGGSSMDAVKISQRLKEEFSRDVAVVDIFRYPTIRSLAASLGQEDDDFSTKQTDIFEAIDKGKQKIRREGPAGMDIAVIGMAGRFPGAGNIETYWENLKNGVESISFFTDEELEDAGVEPDLLQNPNYVNARGILPDIDCFDSQFFGYTPGEAEVMDPQMRMLHETVWEALEDAGYAPGSYNGRIGLYAGGGSSFYWESLVLLASLGGSVDSITKSNLTNKDFLCTRVSYKLDLKGPAFIVNAACSSSLVALDLAAAGILLGKCEMALAGGVRVLLPHKEGYLYQPGMIESPDGHCRAFDAAARGTVGGEGAGIVVLKPLADAEADGDHIYAVVKGTATNNDGLRKVGFQAPSIEGQAEVISAAIYSAGAEPESIGYIEAHGTGTPLGDPVEMEALKLAFGKNTKRNLQRNYCAIGSVKTNIGHLDSAAGIAGFIKAVLSLKHQTIPPSLHFETPNPKIDFENSPFYVNAKLRKWTNDKYPLRAGVSSFGIGGTNAHVVLEEWRGKPKAGIRERVLEEKHRLIILSAKSEAALEKMTGNLVRYLKENPASLADTAYTLQIGRKHMECRKAVAGAASEEIIRNLNTSAPAVMQAICPLQDTPKVLFMFPGLGAQYVNMGRGLYLTEPVFREALDRCFDILTPMVKDETKDIKDILYPSVQSPGPDRREITPPVMFAVQYALALLLMDLGITPHAMIGYSFGEFAAACISGVLTLEDALKLIVARGRLVEKTAPGAMLSVPLAKERVKLLLGGRRELSLAIDNGPSCIVAGADDAICGFEKEMKKNRLLCMRVQTARAFHSNMMAPILTDFEEEAARVTLNEPGIPYVSNVTGTWATPGEVTSPSYWARHLGGTVQFADGIRELIKTENPVFLEIGPGRDLCTLLVRHTEDMPGLKAANMIRRRDQMEDDGYFLVNKLGRLWLWGVDIRWEQMYPGEQRRRLSLPKYPFQKTRFRIPKFTPGMGLDRMADAIARSKLQFQEPLPSEAPESGANDRIMDRYRRSQLSADYVPPDPEDGLMMALARIWSGLFGVPEVGVNDDFFELGGDSLKAMTVLATIHKELKAEISLADFFKRPTISALAEYIDTSGKSEHFAVPLSEKREYYALSPAQQRMYFLQQLDRDATGYNIPFIMGLEDRPGNGKLEKALRQLIYRHEILRTSFETVNGQPVQIVHDTVDFSIEEFDLATKETKGHEDSIQNSKFKIINSFIRPFDLASAPLFRAVLLRTEDSGDLLILDFHHIITDGASMGLLTDEFLALYAGGELPEPRLHYKDYAQWLNDRGWGEVIEGQEAFWLDALSGDLPVLNLPTDYPRPVSRSFEGDRVRFELTRRETGALKQLGRENGATLFMTVLSVFAMLMSRISGDEEVIVGVPIAGRRRPDFQDLIGLMVNTLAMRSYPTGDKTFRQFLGEVKNHTIQAYENQEYPFDRLVEKLSLHRDTGRNPVFDVLFNLVEQADPGTGVFRNREDDGNQYEYVTAKFDLNLTVLERRQCLVCDLEYCSELFKKETVQRLAAYFKRIATAVTGDPGTVISGVEITGSREKEEILHRFNNFEEPFGEDKPIPVLFREQVERTPDGIALTGPVELQLSYKELDKISDAAACRLLENGAASGDMTGILAERSMEMIIAILAILKCGCAYVPLNPNAPAARNRFMLNDCRVRLLLTTHDLPVELTEGIEVMGIADAMNCAPATGIHPLDHSAAKPNSLAYVIYTSGSTGLPKGVAVTHGNFCQLIHWGYRHLGMGPKDRALQNLSYYFDWSVWEIFITLTTGASLYMAPGELLLDPSRSVEFMNAHGITVLHVTPTQHQYIVGAHAHPVTLRYLFIGAEKLTYDLAARSFASVHQDCRLFNMYGPTEATIISAVLELDRDSCHQYRRLTGVPIGTPTGNTTLLILDKYMHLCPVGIPGELHISGGGVTRGYLNNPELTAEKFVLLNRSYGTYRTYKTGDLARWLPDGAVEFLGRIDQQVKIRGFRIEPGEVENRILEHEGVKEAVVMDRETEGGEKYLCAYVVYMMEPVLLKDYLSGILPDYMVPAYFVELENIPLNPNGKVNRNALPEPDAGSAAVVFCEPRTETEKKLAEIWAQALDSRRPIGIDDNFFEVGGHSLKATLVTSKISEVFGVKLEITDIFTSPTIRMLGGTIETAKKEDVVMIETAPEQEYYPLSSAQKRLYILQQMDRQGIMYNIPFTTFLQGEVDLETFNRAFAQLIRRHESLRTSFQMVDDEPVQRIHDSADFSMEYIDLPTEEQEDIIQNSKPKIINSFIRPFDLSRAPLFRARLTKTGDRHYILAIDMHHIISDGASTAVMIREFAALYQGKELPAPVLQYKDFAVWQNRQSLLESYMKQEAFWLDVFSDDIPVLELPYDYIRPAVQSFEGKNYRFEINGPETEALKKSADREGSTLFMMLLAVYNIFLSRMSGQESIVVGTPVAGRNRADLNGIIGMFVNTLALRNEPAGHKTVRRFLKEVKDNALASFLNQDYQYEELVEKLALTRNAGRNPLFDTMLVLQNKGDIPELELPGLSLKPAPMDLGIAKFDLMLLCEETGDGLLCHFEYCTELFKPGTIERFAGFLKRIVSAVVERQEQSIWEIGIISEKEEEEILHRFNNFEEPFNEDKTIPQLFREQVERTPDNIALAGPGQLQLSYKKLDEISDGLAGYLLEKGAASGDMIGILAERSVEMIFSIIAILKAGCAYVPLNPNAPAARNRSMLDDCNVRILLTTNDFPVELTEGLEVSPLPVSPDQLAYVIYTSGSTGMPKGVAVSHANFCQLIHWGYRHLGLGPTDRVLQNLSYYFDWSVWEIFISLTTGAALYMVPGELLLDPRQSISFMNTHCVTVLHVTPTQYRYFAGAETQPVTLRYLFLGAEKLTYDLVKRSFASVHRDCRVFNMYGPTEATIISAVLEISRDSVESYRDLTSIPIGTPTGNTCLYILDKHLDLCPVNVPGELHITGGGLSRGYLNNPELTAARFTDFYRSNRSYRSYKTGDLAKWLPDGTIEFLGRIDQQVKIRGFRIELGEIENRLLEHDGVKDAVVIDRDTEKGEKYLCAYVVYTSDAVDLKVYLSELLPGYMVPAYFVELENIPLNPNGKVNRDALPQPVLGSRGTVYTPPRDIMEQRILEIWSDVLGFDDHHSIGIDDNFFDLGGHSLKATTLVHRVYKDLEVKIDLQDVFTHPTVRELAQKARGGEKIEFEVIVPAEKKEYYELSYAQRRLWVLCQFEEDSTAYNIPLAVTITGNLDEDAFSRAVQELSNRHESLRTVFRTVDGAPFQVILPYIPFKLEISDLRHLDNAAQEEETRQIYRKNANMVFHLENGPLFLFKLVQLEDEKYILIYNIHHIISDGWSQGNITNEIVTLYNYFLKEDGIPPLPPLELQYKDYSHWHNRLIGKDRFQESREYWLEKFSDKPNGVELPLDRPRKAIQTFNGGRVAFTLDMEMTAQLQALSLQGDATLFMGLLTLLNIFLYRYTGQRDIIIGSPIANRKQPELHLMVGFLVNTLVFRNNVDPALSFEELLQETKNETLASYKNQDFPFDLLVEGLELDRDMSQSPVFNVMLAHNNTETGNEQLTMEGVTASPYVHSEDFNMSKFDLTFFADEADDRVVIRIEYNSDLFECSTIQGMAANFLTLAADIFAGSGKSASSLTILREEERKTVVEAFNDTREPFPALTLRELFEQQAERFGDRCSVVSGQWHITYGELNQRANRLARFLLSRHHVKPNDIIGISMDRGIDMIAVIWGVIKSGAGYLAVDPTYPRERVLHVLEDSRAGLLIADRIRPELYGGCTGEIIELTAHWRELEKQSPENPPEVNQPGDVLYVNYTSGSTGTPNGAMLSHDCLTNLILWQNRETAIDCSLRVLQFTSINFCVSFQEIAGTLTSGGQLHLIGDVERQDTAYLMDFLSRHRIQVLFLPFSYLNFLFTQSSRWTGRFKHSLEHIITAGEQLKITSGFKQFLEENPHLQVHNHYGSTEMHVVTSYTLDASTAGQTPIPPAGKPISNIKLFILDEHLNPLPIGVWGELMVAGDTEILGYIGNKELTDAKLVHHPVFSKESNIRLYRSGDIGRWLPDGNIELRGRKDFLVKVRGFRVEPGEIESKILSIEGVRECVVVVKEDNAGQKFLVAYASTDGIGAGEIKRILGGMLPQYMVPQLTILDGLPLMPNGKVDRERLPEPEPGKGREYLPPRDDVEKALVEIWSQLLGVAQDSIGIDDNFFDLGGHSLRATTMMGLIQKGLGVKVELLDIFKTPTIRDLAFLLNSIRLSGGPKPLMDTEGEIEEMII